MSSLHLWATAVLGQTRALGCDSVDLAGREGGIQDAVTLHYGKCGLQRSGGTLEPFYRLEVEYFGLDALNLTLT